MNADIWMPLYIGDYLADTRRLTTEQHGAYLLIIMDYWKNGPPPDDDETLARIAVCTLEKWKLLKATIKSFFQVADGWWTHRRIDSEKENAIQQQHKMRENSLKGVAARRALGQLPKEPKVQPLDEPKDNQRIVQRRTPSPSPSPSPSKTQSPLPKEGESDAGASPARFNPDIKTVFDEWNSQKVLPQCLVVSDGRRQKLTRRLQDPFFKENWKSALQKAIGSSFCRGESERGWKATFDWFIQPESCLRLMEGKYDNGKPKGGPAEQKQRQENLTAPRL